MSAPARARIRIAIDTLTGGQLQATYCRQCPDAACAAACPSEAIAYDGLLGAWIVDEDECVGCGACEDACSYQAIRLDPVTDLAAKCDLCGGSVRCVEICATQALQLVEDADR